MINFTIEDFWTRRLVLARTANHTLIRGWSFERRGLDEFKEAPLGLNQDLSSDIDPTRVPVILISAPGAVGKSTLARQIAFITGAVYVDLAKADPVGGNTISGGLVKSGLYPSWQSEETALLIDGLDEARLRVTQEAFEAFLRDVSEVSAGRRVPTILFGRTGAIQDAWLVLSSDTAQAAVLEIGYYGPDASLEFAYARVEAAHSDPSSELTRRRAITMILDRLRTQTSSDGDRFAGYAPVLQAVAESVAKEKNLGLLISDIERGAQPITLQSVVSSILERERGKLDQLDLEDKSLSKALYLPEEQLQRLVAHVYNVRPPDLLNMGPTDSYCYSNALATWVSEHPFLNGKAASSAVFEAIITSTALKHHSSSDIATNNELSRASAANPFLSEFYLPSEPGDDDYRVPPEHVGIVYTSLRARLSLGDSANLLIEGYENANEEEALEALVEITMSRRDNKSPRILQFRSLQVGTLRLGNYVHDVEVSLPESRVEIGPGTQAVLIAPVSIQCANLAITANELIIECPTGHLDGAILLEAEAFAGDSIASVPVTRGPVSLACVWPNANAYPWTSFAAHPAQNTDPRLDEALRRFRKFVIAFRSHSKGSLARYQDKLDHARMTKGAGRAVLNLMLVENIISLRESMYYLDPDRLGIQTGATYADCVARRFGQRTIDFIVRALK